MKQYINIFASTLAVAMLLSGCANQEPIEPVKPAPVDKDKQEIQFRFFVDEGTQIIPYEDYWNAVNGHSRASRSDMPAEFWLYGVYNTVDVPDGTGAVTSTEAAPVGKRFFNGVKINGDGTYTGERRYWLADGTTRHTFAAYANASTDAKPLYAGFTRTTFIPIIYEQCDADPTNQKDLLLAYGPTNVIVDGVAPIVNIYFRHAIARLLFKISISGGTPLYDCVLNIAYVNNEVIYSNNIYYTGTPEYIYSWAFNNKAYDLNTPMTIPTSASSEDNAIELGDMMMMPQTLKNNWLTLTLSYAKTPGGAKTSLKTQLTPQTLEMGMQYNYFLYVNELTESLSITNIVVNPWTTEIRVADPLN